MPQGYFWRTASAEARNQNAFRAKQACAKALADESGESGIRTLVPISIGKRFSRPPRSATPATLRDGKNSKPLPVNTGGKEI